jgi:vitamin B12 transporter
LTSPFPKRRGALALLASAAALAALTARASDPSEPPEVELPEVVVRVPRATAAADPTVAATVVEADRFAGEAKDVAELLSTSPGVWVVRYGAPGQPATAQIRGVDADGVKVLLDGLPLGTAGGGVDLSSIPRQWISRLEVVRGPGGAALGAGALGGAVNVVTRTAEAGSSSAEVTGGSFGTYAASVDGAARAGDMTVFAAASAETTNGDFPYLFDDRPLIPGTPLVRRVRENDGATRGGLLAKIGGPAGALRLDALVQASGGRRELPGSPQSPTPSDWSEDGRVLATVRAAGAPARDVALAVRAYGRADRLDVKLASSGPDPLRQHGGEGGGEAELTVSHARGVLAATAGGGAEGYSSDALGGTRVRPSASASLADDLAVVPGWLRVEPVVRIERTGGFSGVSAKLGAVARLGEAFSIRASGGRTWRAPSFAELYLEQGLLAPNPDLRPEVGQGADAAVSYDGPLGVASVGGHATVYDDLITYEPASLYRFKPFNTGRALATGVEAAAATAPARRVANLTLSGSYTFLHTEILRGPPDLLGNALPRRPRHVAYARAAIAPGPFGAHLEARVVRDQFADRRNEVRIPDATVLAAGASVRVWRAPRVSLHVELDNLADVRTLTDGYGYPLPGRTLMVSLRAGSAPTEGPP